MIIAVGSKILVNHRRLFSDDHPRYFIGVAEGYEQGIVRATGFTWIRDQINGSFQKRKDPRTKILSLASGTLICYLLPENLSPDIATLNMEVNRIFLIDKSIGLKMELTEGLYPK